MAMTLSRTRPSDRRRGATVHPLKVHELFAPIVVPDIIEWCVSDKYLNRPLLYPRQATMLKVMTLQTELFTDYDWDVIDEWTRDFHLPDPDEWIAQHPDWADDGESQFCYQGLHGIVPDIETRIRMCKDEGRKWFREILPIIGRRGSKGHMGALVGSYVLWNYIALGDPQEHYGVDRGKRLSAFVFAAKKEQARDNQWRDLYRVILGGPCFTKYISKAMGESLTLYSPHDLQTQDEMYDSGIDTTMDTATFEILPKESTLVSGRGPASFMQYYDEMAHVVVGVAKADAAAVYGQATPALDTFGLEAFLYEGSSPWAMTGQFYENAQKALEVDPTTRLPIYPEMLLMQLTSWDPYEDWEIAHELPVRSGDRECFLPLKRAQQSYDAPMRRLERANPDKFKVERLSHWGTALDAYLDPDLVDRMFGVWNGQVLTQRDRGALGISYVAHGDPSKSGANFGFAIGHTEGPDGDGLYHVVFDVLHAWSPSDFDDGHIDYVYIENELEDYVNRFAPTELTFDQFNSASLIGQLKLHAMKANLPRRVQVYERTATAPQNWRVAETFKTALGMDLVHAPPHELAQLELKFLQKSATDRVDHPTSGPVQTKDVADCIMIVTQALIGDQMSAYIKAALGGLEVSGSQEAYGNQTHDEIIHNALSSSNQARGGGRYPNVPQRPLRRQPGVPRSGRRRRG